MTHLLEEGKEIQKKELVPTEMRRLFMEISLMGFGSGFKLEALHILHALRIADPKAAYPLLGLAQVHIFHYEMEAAERLLLDLEASPHMQDPWIAKMIQEIRIRGVEFAKAVNKSLSDSDRYPGSVRSAVAI